MEEGLSVAVPELLFRLDQNVVPFALTRLALSKVNVLGLPACAPLLFQARVMLETVTSIYGLVIVMLITLVPLITLILLAEIVLQQAAAVEVLVGVGVDVAVAVIVAVGVLVGMSVGVLLGRGVYVG